jgi:hypothetical protein
MAFPDGIQHAVMSRYRPVTCYEHKITFSNRREFRNHLKEMHFV